MKLLIMFMLAFGMLAVAPFAASAQPSTTFRDSMGRTVGTASTNSNGTTTFRDGSGRHYRHSHHQQQRHNDVP